MTHSLEVVTSIHPPDDPRIRTKTIRTLADAGWSVTYTCRAPGPSDTSGLEVVTLRGGRFVRSIRASGRILRARAEVTSVHDPELLPAAILSGLIRDRDRVVFDVHENMPLQFATRSATPSWLRGPSAWCGKVMLRIAERFVTISLAEASYRDLFRREHEVFSNHPVFVDLPMISKSSEGFVYVGDVTRERGAILLARAVSALGGRHRLTFVGRCRQDLAIELVAAAGQSVDLRILGFLPYVEAWEIAAEHRVGVSPLLDRPNYRNSLPTKIDEYRSVGLVAVVSDLPASLDAITGSHAALSFTAGSVEALTDALGMSLEPERAERAIDEIAAVRSGEGWPAARVAAFYSGLVT